MRLRDADYRCLAEVRHLIRRFMEFSERQARAAGLEPRQHQVLLAIRGAAGGRAATIGDLAGRLLLRHHSTVELVDRLEEGGLVARRRGALDRRQVFVQLSARGSRVLDRLSRIHLAELRSSGPALARALAELLAPDEEEKTREATRQATQRTSVRPRPVRRSRRARTAR